ncbi:MAG: hypothetical protein MI807_15660, partial [Verrucomicrobiales bacterium]|nr:hypothetical protein [Verrucomicrobiales bacterium]
MVAAVARRWPIYETPLSTTLLRARLHLFTRVESHEDTSTGPRSRRRKTVADCEIPLPTTLLRARLHLFTRVESHEDTSTGPRSRRRKT